MAFGDIAVLMQAVFQHGVGFGVFVEPRERALIVGMAITFVSEFVSLKHVEVD
jgi:hypothetical protein